MFNSRICEKKNIMLSEEFENSCRLCLNQNAVVNVFETKYQEIVFADIIATFSILKITSTDYLPKKICTACQNLVTEFYKFMEKVKEAQLDLHDIFVKMQKQEKYKEENTKYLENDQLDCISDYTNNSDSQVAHINSKKPITCSFCSSQFETHSAYIMHRKREADSRRKKQHCTVCKKLINSYKLKDHMNSHTKEKPHQCQICGEKFRFLSNLCRHKFQHTDKKPHICHICGKGFIQAPSLTDHILTHSGEKSYMCNICGITFITKHALGNHINMHKFKDNNTDSDELTCPECNKCFKFNHLLKKHLQIHWEKEFLCSQCGKKFATKVLLDSHAKIHVEIKAYTCNTCKKEFGHKNSFMKHMKTHSGEKPVVCVVCGKKFSQKGHLTYHMRKHNGEKPYSCSYCEKKFDHSGSFKIHTRIHTGEKPYKCDVCLKSFYDTSGMKKHKKQHVTGNLHLVL